MLQEKCIGTKFKAEEILAIGVTAWRDKIMKLSDKQLIALQNMLDCMEHYMLIDHVRDEYGESDWNDLHEQVETLQSIVNKHLPVADRPFERIQLVFPQ
jgi:hypothetical protein